MLKFEWNESKATANVGKHGCTFEEAASVFGDPMALTFDDPEHSRSEQRFLTFGIALTDRLLAVVHTDRGNKVRIISARHATKRERKIYEAG